MIADSILLRRFRDEGDEASFTTLFNRHYDRVYGVLFRMTGSRQEAEDLAQEVFLRLYQRPMRRADNVSGWLYRVALNTGYNALRSDKRRERREQVAAPDESGPSPEETAIRRQMRADARAALAQLKPRDAKMLILQQMDMSYREIAETLDVAETSVGKMLARARDAFAEAYERITYE